MVTAQSIAQATDRVVARYKAGLFGGRAVLDLCGGIGGDALELARHGAVATVDHDPQLTAMAAANLAAAYRYAESVSAHGGAAERDPRTATAAASMIRAVAICADVTRYPIAADAAIHIDPDRRPGQRRTTQPSQYLPSLRFVETLVGGREAAIVKLAPAAALHQDAGGLELIRRHHRQWISLDFSVREQSLLCGEAIHAAAGVTAGGRSAVRLMRSGTAQRFAITAQSEARLEQIDRELPCSDEPPRMIYDLDPAVRGAGLSAAFALARGLTALGGAAGFFGSDALAEDLSLVQCFETLWSGPADRKQIKRELRHSGWTLQSVKVRGSDHDPAELLRALREEKQRPAVQRDEKQQSEAQQPVTLLVGRHRRGVYGVIARKLEDRGGA